MPVPVWLPAEGAWLGVPRRRINLLPALARRAVRRLVRFVVGAFRLVRDLVVELDEFGQRGVARSGRVCPHREAVRIVVVNFGQAAPRISAPLTIRLRDDRSAGHAFSRRLPICRGTLSCVRLSIFAQRREQSVLRRCRLNSCAPGVIAARLREGAYRAASLAPFARCIRLIRCASDGGTLYQQSDLQPLMAG